MTLLRLLILTVVMTLGTVLVGWWVVPVVAAAYGVTARRTGHPGLLAGGAAAAGWGGYLAVVAFGGTPIGRFGADLAGSMGLPSWAPHLATMLFPALLAAPAAYLTARIGLKSDTVRPRR